MYRINYVLICILYTFWLQINKLLTINEGTLYFYVAVSIQVITVENRRLYVHNADMVVGF